MFSRINKLSFLRFGYLFGLKKRGKRFRKSIFVSKYGRLFYKKFVPYKFKKRLVIARKSKRRLRRRSVYSFFIRFRKLINLRKYFKKSVSFSNLSFRRKLNLR